MAITVSLLSQADQNSRPQKTGAEARMAIRAGDWQGPTAGLAPGFEQANLVVIPQEYAFDFARFCIRNPKPCPLLDVTAPGSSFPSYHLAQNADLRTDLPLYRVHERGEIVAEVPEITSLWDDSMVAFLLGCSFSFENALLSVGIPVRHIERNCNVPMYRTSWQCRPAGIFQGPLVVTMRPLPRHQIAQAVEITSRFPAAHGAPVNIGDADGLGIADLNRPDYGDPVPVYPGEIPVFWACGVTAQAVAKAIQLPLMITHAPGHMLILDRKIVDYGVRYLT
jgi:uncharacterized protein YcsI (UPF0317 family)